MARKQSTVGVTPLPETNTAAFQEEAGALSMLGSIAQGIQGERDIVNQMLGQIQMSRAISKFTDVVSLQKLKHIKETKMYRALAGQKGFDRDGNEIADVGTFDGFCRALGTSASKVDEDLKNLSVFGEEALQQLTQIGAGYRELRQYRRLPEDDKSALIEAAKSGDSAAFVDLAEELISKHVKEKDELQKRLDESQRDLDALSQVEADTNRKLRDAKLELERNQLRTAPWSDKVAPLQVEIAKRQTIIDEATGRHLQAVEALDAFWMGELASQPDYDPEAPAEMPLEVSAVLVELHDAINRSARQIAAARNELLNRFGPELEKALQHQLLLEEEPA